MAINVSDIFKIREIPCINRCEWSVTWDGYGQVTRARNQFLILDAAARATADQFGLSLNNGTVLWISPEIFFQGTLDAEAVVEQIGLDSPINGVAFVQRKSAEKFVESMEQVIIVNLLKQTEYD